MKTKLSLLAATALAPLTLSAQSPDAGGAASPQVAPATSPAAGRLPHVVFDGANLREIVATLQARGKEAGHDPNVDPLNVVISPGLEDRIVPSLSLRNVSPTEVLTVATTVLGLRLEPVTGDSGQAVAWLIKAPEGQFWPPAGSTAAKTSPVALPGDPSGGATPSGFPGGTLVHAPAAGQYTPPVPYAVQIAASPSSADPFGIGGSPQPQSRVFGVTSLISSEKGDPQSRENDEAEKLDRLIRSLEKMAADQGVKAQINAYGELDILVVKSGDIAALALIAEAIEAMKSNTARGDNSHQARENALRAEMSALKAQMDIAIAEREMTKRTTADQLELLKAAQKAEDAARTKR